MSALGLQEAHPFMADLLEVGYQWEILEFLERLNRQHGVTIVVALHDLQQAAWFSH